MKDSRPEGAGATSPVSRLATGECPPGHDPNDRGSAFELRLAEMRAHLARTRPTSDAEALQMLRAAFPGTSLSDRVAVLTGRVG